ncbi:MAG TPA: class I SAM-dependent rRNA methyltransferase [Gemmatimonadaceae bacterium]|nr:class I SAM-dependent rRNA methyltransferase [Gemmatimonadaceae bacterium]
MSAVAVVSTRGARRWARGHAWIFRSDVVEPPAHDAGAVAVREQRGRQIGWALWSPSSEIALRLLDPDPVARIDAGWWQRRIAAAVARRDGLDRVATAYRLVHGEGDGLPSLVVDRYDRWLVVQLLSAGVEAYRGEIVDALGAITGAAGMLARNDASVRAREGLERRVEPLTGTVPDHVEVDEHGVRYAAAPHSGQKTGAFLDQRENRVLVGTHARGRALDLFSYHGSFALHLARRASAVTAVDSSAAALERGRANAALNGYTNIAFVESDAFEFLRRARGDAPYDTIVVDPPAFAKNKPSLAGAIRGYRDLNLHAMRLLAPGGILFTASCSYHLGKAAFLEMVADAAAESGRRLALRAITAQPADHPELVTLPETGYLKGALLEAHD